MNDRLSQYVEGRMSADEARAFERELAAESPALLRAVRALRAAPPDVSGEEPGPWFTDKVMARYDAHLSSRRRRLVDFLLTPRAVRFRPVTAVAAAAVAAVALVAALRATPAPEGAVVVAAEPVQVTLRLHAPGATRVNAVGDFNGWSREATPLVPAGDGAWVARVKLRPGVYQYSFLLDGATFVADPEATEKVDDGFGNVNAVLKL